MLALVLGIISSFDATALCGRHGFDRKDEFHRKPTLKITSLTGVIFWENICPYRPGRASFLKKRNVMFFALKKHSTRSSLPSKLL